MICVHITKMKLCQYMYFEERKKESKFWPPNMIIYYIFNVFSICNNYVIFIRNIMALK